MRQGNRNRDPRAVRRAEGVGAMAHRRQLAGRNLVGGGLGALVLFLLLAGSVHVANRVNGLRAEIARLENRRAVLEASSADLLTKWNRVTAPRVIIERARTELGLVAPQEPGLVLVQLPSDGQRTSPWRRFMAGMGGGDAVAAAQAAPAPVLGTMVSLTPRRARPVQGD